MLGVKKVGRALNKMRRGKGLLPCDVRPALHKPDVTLDRYGNDSSGAITYRMNSAGYRSEELSPGAAYKIALIGESHAVGVGVDFDKSFGQRFKAHLCAALDREPGDINLLNFSAGGISADYCLRTLTRQIEAVRPDLVLVNLPGEDRVETFLRKDKPINYNLSGIDLEKLDEAPDALLGFVDFYKPQFGRVNLVKNALMLQSICKAHGAELLICTHALRPKRFRGPVLSPFYQQLDRKHLVLQDILEARPDLAADGQHAGPRAHEALAIALLDRFAEIIGETDRSDWVEPIGAYVHNLKSSSPDWAFVRRKLRI